jgi:hypothetical protein
MSSFDKRNYVQFTLKERLKLTIKSRELIGFWDRREHHLVATLNSLMESSGCVLRALYFIGFFIDFLDHL